MAVRSPETVNERLTNGAPLLKTLISELCKVGTVGVYADSANPKEIASRLGDQARIPDEIVGNTTNQHFISEVLRNYLHLRLERGWLSEVDGLVRGSGEIERSASAYTVLCGKLGTDIVGSIVGTRPWEINLPLRLDVYSDQKQATRFCFYLRDKLPEVLIKISFAAHQPGFLLLARDLERSGIRVNITGMFSVRQAIVAAVLVDASRSSIFMGRINRGVGAAFLGEHVILSAQRCLRRLRHEGSTKSRLIVSSVREARSIAETAGCDYITAPCETIRAFMDQELNPVEITSQLETSYESCLGLNGRAIRELGLSRIAQLYHLEIEFLEFLTELRKRLNKEPIQDTDKLFALFELGGFGEIFYSPSPAEWRDLRRSRLPDLDSELTRRIPLDTLYSLLAFADFKTAEENVDAEIKRAMVGL
jgi:transaldolase